MVLDEVVVETILPLPSTPPLVVVVVDDVVDVVVVGSLLPDGVARVPEARLCQHDALRGEETGQGGMGPLVRAGVGDR